MLREIEEINTVFDFIRWMSSKSDLVNGRIILEPEINPRRINIKVHLTSPNAEQCEYYTGLPDPLFMCKMVSVEYDESGSPQSEVLRALAIAVARKIGLEEVLI